MRPGPLLMLFALTLGGCTCADPPASPTAPPAAREPGKAMRGAGAGVRTRRGRIVRIAVVADDLERAREAVGAALATRLGATEAWADLGCSETTYWDTSEGHLHARGYALRHGVVHAGDCDGDRLTGVDTSLGFAGDGPAAGAAARDLASADGGRYTVLVLDGTHVSGAGTEARTTALASKRGKAGKGGRATPDPSGAARVFPTLAGLYPPDRGLVLACGRQLRETRWRWGGDEKDANAPVFAAWHDTASPATRAAELQLRSPPAEDEVFTATATAIAADLAAVGLLAPTLVDPAAWATTCP